MSNMKHPSDRSDLHDMLYCLQRFAIHPKYIESDGSILCELSQEHELEERTDIYINEDGVSIRHWNHNDFYDLVIGQETLMQLAAMSTCFAVGYAKAKYEAEEARKNKSHDLPPDHNE